MTITCEQCRAARAFLGWNLIQLGKETGLSFGTIKNFEKNHVRTTIKTLGLIKKAFQDAGMSFINESSGEGIIVFKDGLGRRNIKGVWQ